MGSIDVETQANGSVFLYFDNVARRNALNIAMIAALRTHLETLASQASCRTVIFCGRGEHFCAGRDISELGQAHERTGQEIRSDMELLGALAGAIRGFPKPTLALVRGYALGLGAAVVALCDIAFAAVDARLGFPEMKVGIAPSLTALALTRSVAAKHSRLMLLSGALIDGMQAEKIGLVSRALPRPELMPAFESLLTDLAAASPAALAACKGLMRLSRRSRVMRFTLLLASMVVAASTCYGADVYPSKPVRVVVPFATGGTVDFTARVISQQLSEQLGRSFVVDNRTGASGTIANALVARSAPDGYTLMLMDSSTTIVPGLFKTLAFDVSRDFAAVSQIIGAPEALVVHPSLNVTTLKEFVALAQANPGKFNYGSAGPGGAIHLSSELFKIAAKVNVVHIPYKGGGEAMAAVLGGQVQMLLTTISTVVTHVNSGKVRALAVTAAERKRSPVMPDVPTMNEAGVPGMTVYLWFGLVGPAGMPKHVVDKLHAEVVKALAVPAVRERFVAQGAEVVGSSPQEFSAYIRDEVRRWADVTKAAGITPE